jgi:hypothetical protein
VWLTAPCSHLSLSLSPLSSVTVTTASYPMSFCPVLYCVFVRSVLVSKFDDILFSMTLFHINFNCFDMVEFMTLQREEGGNSNTTSFTTSLFLYSSLCAALLCVVLCCKCVCLLPACSPSILSYPILTHASSDGYWLQRRLDTALSIFINYNII